MNKLLSVLLFLITFNTYSQCACVWIDASGVKQCQLYSNCSGPNLSNCANKVTTSTLCPCQQWPGMNWNCGACQSNGACWYNGNSCDADMVCTYIALPIELEIFGGDLIDGENVVFWTTASEHNNDYFLIERSTTGIFDEKSIIYQLDAVGTSTTKTEYKFVDTDFEEGINYYMLTQVDIDGNYESYGPIAIDNRNKQKVVRTINILGQPVDNFTSGLIFIIYESGHVEKVYR